MSQHVSAVFVDPDDAERAIGALEDHGISRNLISVATGSAENAALPAATAADNGVSSRSPLADEEGFVEVQTDDPPTPTDMNAATTSRLGGTEAHTSSVEAEGKFGITMTTPADAAKGAVEGSLVGLGAGLLAGAAALFVPGVGPILAAGPLWAAVGGALGATAAGAVAGGVTGYLRDMGVPEKVAADYERALGAGSVIVSVHAEDRRADEVQAVLHKYGGTAIATH